MSRQYEIGEKYENRFTEEVITILDISGNKCEIYSPDLCEDRWTAISNLDEMIKWNGKMWYVWVSADY